MHGAVATQRQQLRHDRRSDEPDLHARRGRRRLEGVLPRHRDEQRGLGLAAQLSERDRALGPSGEHGAALARGVDPEGQTLATTNGTWSGSTPITYTYAWRRCDTNGNNCVTIGGATSPTYTLIAADVGSKVYSLVTATNSAGSASQRSYLSATALLGPPVNTVRPMLSGVAKVGQTLTTTNGSWSGSAPFTFSYLWRRCDTNGNNCVTIGGANGQTYVVTAADVGFKLFSLVTATNAAGSASQRSFLSAVVAAAP